MQIYSLNTRYNSAPETITATPVDDLVTFEFTTTPSDGNPGPLVIFTMQIPTDWDMDPDIRVNGLIPSYISNVIGIDGVDTVIFAVPFFAASYAVTAPTSGEGTGAAKVTAYAFGNVASVQVTGEATDDYDSGDDETLAVASHGALTDNEGALLFSFFALNEWAEASGTAATVASTGFTFHYPMPAGESWPLNAVRVGDSLSRTAFAVATEEVATLGAVTWSFTNEPSPLSYEAAAFTLLAFAVPDSAVTSYNCECDERDGHQVATLAQLRRRMLIRLGYAAQADNPPPGMAALLNDFLTSAQNFLYKKYAPLRLERFYSWPMTAGIRFYDLEANAEECTKRFNPLKMSWVGVQDPNNAWLPLTQGIPPEFYTMSMYNGIPTRYEIRQCIEVFPAPLDGYTLWIKAHFGLQPFTSDTDETTVDSELVFLWALANAKNHYAQADAKDIASQANTMLGTLVAGDHQTKRYVPGARALPPATPPLFLPLVTP